MTRLSVDKLLGIPLLTQAMPSHTQPVTARHGPAAALTHSPSRRSSKSAARSLHARVHRKLGARGPVFPESTELLPRRPVPGTDRDALVEHPHGLVEPRPRRPP